MKKFLIICGCILLVVVSIYGYKAYRLFSVHKYYKEFGLIKVDSQAFRPENKILPEPIMDFFPSKKPAAGIFVDNYYRHAGNVIDDEYNQKLDTIFKDYIPTNLSEFQAKLAPAFQPKLGYLSVGELCSFEEAERLPNMPDLEKMEEIMCFWCYLSRYFAQKHDNDSAMMLAYAPLTYAKELETKYANCASIKARRVSDSIVKASCLTIVYLTETAKPDARYIRLVVNDLYTILANEYPLSRCVKYKQYILDSIIKAKEKRGSKLASLILNNKVMQTELSNHFEELLKYIDEPLEKVGQEFNGWQTRKKKFFYDPLAELSIFDYERHIPTLMLSQNFPDYYKAKENQEKHVKMLKNTIRRLATYAFNASRGRSPASDEELEKWLGHKLP